MILNDNRFGMVEVRAFGVYTFKVTDPGTFIKEIVGPQQTFTTQDICEQLKSIIVTRFTDAVGESNLPIEAYASNLNELSEAIFGFMKDDFSAYGMDITKFLIENISMPDEIKKEIFELSRLNAIDLDKLTKMKAAKAMEAAANNPSGTSGMGLGLGAGMAMAQQMMQSMDKNTTSTQSTNAPASDTPPPIPSETVYYLGVGGKQIGPYNMQMMVKLAEEQTITKETLVWRKGMAEWSTAGNLDELQSLWTLTPPPLNL